MWTIIRRELIDNVKNFRFILLLIFSVLLFVLNGIVFTEKYYSDLALQDSGTTKFYAGLNYRVFPKPSPLKFVAEGGDKYRPKEYWIRPGSNIRPIPLEQRDSRMPNIPEPDWAFIIKIIFSLYVILMGYNAISGEKEQGTLKLTLSNPLNRSKILVAKYCSLMITVTFTLVFGIIVNIIIISNLMPEIFIDTAVARLLLMFFTTLVYLSVFAFLSLAISSLIYQSSLGLLVLIFLWIVFSIIPDIAGIISSKIAHVRSEMDIVKEYNDFDFADQYEEFRHRVNRGEFSSEEEVKNEGKKFYTELQKNFNRQMDNYHNAVNQRIKLSHNLSRISPMALFEYASERIAGTGIKREENFLKDVKVFSVIFDDYIMIKTGELPLELDFVTSFTVDFNGKKLRIKSSGIIKRDFNEADIPIFQESKPSFIRTLRDALLDISGLLLWNIGLALGAFIAFFRADVR